MPSTLTLMVQVQKEGRFQGASRPAAARLKARTSFPPGCFQQPGDGCNHVWGYGNVQVFTLLFLPAQSPQVPVIEKNVALDRGEDRLCPNGAKSYPYQGYRAGRCASECTRTFTAPISPPFPDPNSPLRPFLHLHCFCRCCHFHFHFRRYRRRIYQ